MKTTYIISTLFLSILIWSCDLMGDVDKVKPYYKLEDQTAIRNAQSAEQVLRGVYSKWRAWDICTFRSHMGILAGSLAISGSGGLSRETGFTDNNVLEDNSIIGNVYNNLYGVINAANFMIEFLENNTVKDLDPVRRMEILGEGYFNRALAHFMLLRFFGQFYDLNSKYGIVISDKPYRAPLSKARSSVADCYRFIEADLDSAILYAPDMPMSNYQPTHATIGKTAAKSLKAKVLLNKGDYVNAALIADDVIKTAMNYGYELQDFMSIYSDMYNAPEVLFAPYVSNYEEQCAFVLERTVCSEYSQTIADALVPGQGNEETREGFDPRFADPFIKPDVITTSYQNGKYPHSLNDDNKSNTYYFLRLGEVYYIHAEAEARQGGSHLAAARQSLQTVLDVHAPGLYDVSTIPDDQLLEMIRQHKWIDLLFENQEEWFDMVRYYKNGDLDITTIRPNIKTDRQLILPIPQSAKAGNKLLETNP